MSKDIAVYTMNPRTDVILFGGDLAEGMTVIEESPLSRRVHGHGEDAGLRAQRFFTVTRLRRVHAGQYQGGWGIEFVAEWVDGYQEARSAHPGLAWLVKRDSLPGEKEDRDAG